jgi:LysR family hydrogen peroxide-inducible transcriptional activator
MKSDDETFRATSLETLRLMVMAGNGVTLMPRIAARTGDGLRYIPFRSPEPEREIALVWRKTSPRKLFLGELASQLRTRFA